MPPTLRSEVGFAGLIPVSQPRRYANRTGDDLAQEISATRSGPTSGRTPTRLPRPGSSLPGLAGAEVFAECARRELAVTGETVSKRTAPARDELTAQERQIARRAQDGHTNPEIGAELFLSSRTVEWHLRKVFTKLGISSRCEPSTALPDLDGLGLWAWRSSAVISASRCL
jgi:DNA-binding NarL/FixJ family response regulator